MNVQDFLRNVDIRLVAEKYVTRRDYDDGVKMPSVDAVEAGYRDFVERLLAKEVVHSDYLIVPVRYNEDGQVWWHAELFKLEDVMNFEPHENMAEMEEKVELAKTLPLEEVPALLTEGIECYSYTFDSWENILGFKIVLTNDSDDVAAEVAEDILWKMAFCGMTEDSREQYLKELEEELKEGERQIENGDYVSAEEMTAEIRNKYGIVDTRTEEEKIATKRQMYVDMLDGDIALTCSLLVVKSKLS